MNSPFSPTLHPYPFSRHNRNLKQEDTHEEPGSKPKKVNSEVRKQQNRIASRNYREKRKRKLLQLQQLVKANSSNQTESRSSPGRNESFSQAIATDYESAGSSPLVLPPTNKFGSVKPDRAVVSNSIAQESDAALRSEPRATTQTYNSLESNWSRLPYSSTPPPPPPPPPPATFSWFNPQWIPDFGYPARFAPCPEDYHYTLLPVQPGFEQTHASYQQPQSSSSMEPYNIYSFTSGIQHQPAGFPIVSLPTSSSYHEDRFHGLR